MTFYKNVNKKPKFMCIIVGHYEAVIQDKETGIYIIPITSLRPQFNNLKIQGQTFKQYIRKFISVHYFTVIISLEENNEQFTNTEI